MRYKQLVQKKLSELNNMINFEDSILSQNRPIEEHKNILERMREKIKEVENLINSENDSF